ncbi:nuclear mitotic apparatus protein 1 [Latimeria chalumnae]|uniref:nuclear mitotic apparatus protein 1 n=1 Tax=Latimeria chalumnae TaxID=7897 RepID=UPI00313E3C17
MKEELVTVKQVNEKLSTELGQVRHKLEISLEQLHQLEAEKKIFTNQVEALETERAQLIGEKEMLMTVVETKSKGQEEDVQALQESYEELRASQEALQRENEKLKKDCREVREGFLQKEAQLNSLAEEQQRVAQHWKDRWQQVAVALRSKEEELEQANAQCQAANQKNSKLLGDCEMLQAGQEELRDLRVALKRLMEEKTELVKQHTASQQTIQLLTLQKEAASNPVKTRANQDKSTNYANENENNAKLASELDRLQKENHKNNTKVNELEHEKAEMEVEIKRLKALCSVEYNTAVCMTIYS